MRELIAEHKPHIDKMNKTGPQLLELSPMEGVPIREKYTTADQLYTKLKADVKERAASLDEAIFKSTQVGSSLFFGLQLLNIKWCIWGILLKQCKKSTQFLLTQLVTNSIATLHSD